MNTGTRAKDKDRERLARDLQKYLDEGGEVEILPGFGTQSTVTGMTYSIKKSSFGKPGPQRYGGKN